MPPHPLVEDSAHAAVAELMVASHRELFEVPREIAYLNNGSFTPLPRPVRAADEAGVAVKSTPRTMEPEAIEPRAAATGFIGAWADERLPATTRPLAAQAENMGRVLFPERFRGPHLLGLRAPGGDIPSRATAVVGQ